MKRKLSKVVLVVFALLVASVLSASGADKVYTIRIGNVTPPNNPLHQAFEKMAAEMNEKSNGRIKFRPAVGHYHYAQHSHFNIGLFY